MSKEENKNEISLKCASCETENKVHLSSEIKCKKCKETLVGYTYKAIILPTMLVVGLSGIAGAIIDDTININRASVKTEFNMVATCIKEFRHINNAQQRCYCAVESMSGVIDAQQARLRGKDWLKSELEQRFNDCI